MLFYGVTNPDNDTGCDRAELLLFFISLTVFLLIGRVFDYDWRI